MVLLATSGNTKGKIALIIGNEGKGISSNIKKQVDEMITIPMMDMFKASMPVLLQPFSCTKFSEIDYKKSFQSSDWTFL